MNNLIRSVLVGALVLVVAVPVQADTFVHNTHTPCNDCVTVSNQVPSASALTSDVNSAPTKSPSSSSSTSDQTRQGDQIVAPATSTPTPDKAPVPTTTPVPTPTASLSATLVVPSPTPSASHSGMIRVAKVASASAKVIQTDKGPLDVIVLYAKGVWEYLGGLL